MAGAADKIPPPEVRSLIRPARAKPHYPADASLLPRQIVEDQRRQRRPACLVVGAQALAGVAVEVLVEEEEVLPVGASVKRRSPPWQGRVPSRRARKRRARRRRSSVATSSRVMRFPEPGGHST